MSTVAFIPVRGGSKSIPLKNIRLFCEKPLVYWNLLALQNAFPIDKIIVATDSTVIKTTVQNFNFRKVEIYDRSPENANDTASTESVMLEFLSKEQLSKSDIFILVQATSPLTQTVHFEEALQMFNSGQYDSILTCVRNKRFFWNHDGTPINYDYKNRPRRQNFEGMMMENGAFYINSVENILRDKNRLSGRIGIYEMPDYTANEIDEPDDWIMLESLMYRHVLKQHIQKQVKLFLTDVDGVLTDGGMYYSEHGDELKKFNTRDGMGMQLLQKAGIKVGIITSENTKIVENRAKKLGVDFLYQGNRAGGKLAVAHELCEKIGISLEEVAYIGDDINCLDILSSVGVSACPADAMHQVKALPGIIRLNTKGGEGCVREFVEMILM